MFTNDFLLENVGADDLIFFRYWLRDLKLSLATLITPRRPSRHLITKGIFEQVMKDRSTAKG
jgi:hypothetical protein